MVGVNVSANDVRLSFGEVDVAWREGDPVILDRASVTIPPRLVPILIKILLNQLPQVEVLQAKADELNRDPEVEFKKFKT